MNLKLKLVIQDYINNGTEVDLILSQDSLDKYLEFFKFTLDDSFKLTLPKNSYNVGDLVKSGMPGDENSSPFILTEENWSEDVYHVESFYISIKDLYNNDIYHYFDLIDGANHIVFNVESYLKALDINVKYNFLEKWEYSETSQRVLITHANCNDGMGVKAVVDYHASNILLEENNLEGVEITTYMLDYNSFDFEELLESLKGKLVYVGDFSFDLTQLTKLKEVVEDIVIVDHHIGVMKKDVITDPNVHVDITKSGAVLAWEFFFGTVETPPPYIIQLIGDRDLWNFFYGDHTKALTLMFKKYKNLSGYDLIGQYMSEDREVSYVKLIDDLEPFIEEVEEAEKGYIKRAKQARPYTINNITMYGLNITSSVSEVLNHVSKIFNTPSFAYWEDENGMFQISFRNKDDSVHMDEIAKIFGGDGHTMASGSKINFTDLMLEEFFINKRLHVAYKINMEDINTHLMFNQYGIDTYDYVNTAHCEVVQTILNKTFHDLFIVKRDPNQDLVLTLKENV